jgi:hypothetical protein
MSQKIGLRNFHDSIYELNVLCLYIKPALHSIKKNGKSHAYSLNFKFFFS